MLEPATNNKRHEALPDDAAGQPLPDRFIETVITSGQPAGPKGERAEVYKRLRGLFEPFCCRTADSVTALSGDTILAMHQSAERLTLAFPKRFLKHCGSRCWGIDFRDGKGADVIARITKDAAEIADLARLSSDPRTYDGRRDFANRLMNLKEWESETYLHTKAYYYSVLVKWLADGRASEQQVLGEEHELAKRLGWMAADLERAIPYLQHLGDLARQRAFGTWIGVMPSGTKQGFGDSLGSMQEVLWSPRQATTMGTDPAASSSVWVGAYGKRHAALLLATTNLLNDFVYERCVDESRRIFEADPELISHISRALPMRNTAHLPYAPLQAMAEGIVTIQQCYQLLTAEAVPRRDDAEALMYEARENVDLLARRLPLGIIGPLSLGGEYLKGVLDPDTMQVAESHLEALERIRQGWVKSSLGKHPTMTGFGCPLAGTGIRRMTDAYLHVYSALARELKD